MGIEEIIDAYHQRLFKLCLFYLKNPQEAEEILQDIFIKILKKKSTFEGKSDIYTWIYRIAVNTLLNYIKRKQLIDFFSLDFLQGAKSACKKSPPGQADHDSPLMSDSAGRDPAHVMEKEQELQRKIDTLETCIQRLSDREKTAFYFFHYDGLKQKEIAEIMDTSLSAVEALLHKAMKKLKACAQT
ncbi:MAG: RNA polymerase sigma factor [bacterium]|nr:RNA polymerase sigma factor [bacterium]